jgi:hypothetical protein
VLRPKRRKPSLSRHPSKPVRELVPEHPYATRLAEITPIRKVQKNGKEIEDSIAAPVFLRHHSLPEARIPIRRDPNYDSDFRPHRNHKKEIRESPSPE